VWAGDGPGGFESTIDCEEIGVQKNGTLAGNMETAREKLGQE
jgi:hypothetical protein